MEFYSLRCLLAVTWDRFLACQLPPGRPQGQAPSKCRDVSIHPTTKPKEREHHIWTPSQSPQTHMLNCSLSSQKSRFLTSPKHLKNTKWSITSPPKALQCMDMHVAFPQTSCRQSRQNSNEWASYSVHLVNGHHCSMCYLRLQEVGDLAVTTGA